MADSKKSEGFGAANYKVVIVVVLAFMAFMKSANEKRKAGQENIVAEQVAHSSEKAKEELKDIGNHWKDQIDERFGNSRNSVKNQKGKIEPYDFNEEANPTSPKRDRTVNQKRNSKAALSANGRKSLTGQSELSFVSWNLNEMGRSKNDEEIAFMANVLRDFDVVALQEIVVSSHGAKAVAKLVEELNRTGNSWDYAISDPTSGSARERYAYLWKTDKVKLASRPWLDFSLSEQIDREPYLARFETADAFQKRFLCSNFHAVPKLRKPEREVALLESIQANYPSDHVLIMGDFNLPENATAFDGLKSRGFKVAMRGQPTTLRKKVDDYGDYFSESLDHIFFEDAPFSRKEAGYIDIVKGSTSLSEARKISDHLPVYVNLRLE